jgi:hypothetical protein
MSMSHKAYAFDWNAFECDELFTILIESLESNDVLPLAHYIEIHRAEIKDPYKGELLTETWQEMLEKKDIQEYGDFAITRFYDPTIDMGIGEKWLEIEESLSDPNRGIFLGSPVHSKNNVFDPGYMGAYFQTPAQVSESLRKVSELATENIESFQSLLEDSNLRGLGVYVTF